MQTSVTLDYSSTTNNKITSIDASDSVDASHEPNMAFGGGSPDASYQAAANENYVYFIVEIAPSLNLQVTTVEFRSTNADQITVSVINANGFPILNNQVWLLMLYDCYLVCKHKFHAHFDKFLLESC